MIAKPSGDGVPAYYQKYFDLVLEDDLGFALDSGRSQMLALLNEVPDSKLSFSYAPGKWSLAQVLLHIMDTERVLNYRALAFARCETQSLPGFNEQVYAENAGAEKRQKADLLAEYEGIRAASITFFKHCDPTALDRIGKANEVAVTPKAIGWMIAGHELHHCKVIRERYL